MGIFFKFVFVCFGSVMVIALESKIVELCSDYNWVYVYICTNDLGKGMNPELLPPVMGYIVG